MRTRFPRLPVPRLCLWVVLVVGSAGCIEYSELQKQDPFSGEGEDPEPEGSDSGVTDSGDPTPTDTADTAGDTGSWVCEAEHSDGGWVDPSECTGDDERPQGTSETLVEWSWEGTDLDPEIDDVLAPPSAAPIWDMNDSGTVDRNDIPALLFVASREGEDPVLVALEGTGGTRWELEEIDGSTPDPTAATAIADLDDDGTFELLVVLADGRMAALDPEGALVWTAETDLPAGVPLAAFDMDSDGEGEVLAGNVLVDESGCVDTELDASGCAPDYTFAADLDSDWQGSWVYGGSTWERDGDRRATLSTDHPCHPTPVLSAGASESRVLSVDAKGLELRLVDLEGIVQWSHTLSEPVGPPAVGDPDGDGEPEVCLAAGGELFVYEPDSGSVSTVYSGDEPTETGTPPGCVMVELDADGVDEILYTGAQVAVILNASTGETWLEDTDHSSTGTGNIPLVLDLDADGSAEIVVASDDREGGTRAGLTAYGNPDDGWQTSGRKMWTQHAFDPEQVDDDAALVGSGGLAPGQRFRNQTELPVEQSPAIEVQVQTACADSCTPVSEGELGFVVINHGGVEADDVRVVVEDVETGSELEAFDLGTLEKGEISPSVEWDVEWPDHAEGIRLVPSHSGWSCVDLEAVEVPVPCD